MKNKKILLMILLTLSVIPITGCTKYVKGDGNKIITSEETGERLVDNILCKPTKDNMLKLYDDNNIDITNIPDCKEFKITSNGYEGIWTTIFVKPLAFLIIKLTSLIGNAGVAIILLTLLIRGILYPVTYKTAMQSEIMAKAKPELDKIEKKYKNKNTQEDQLAHSQEMMMVYKKYGLNPMSGCIFALIQIPLFFAFYESLYRLPVLFEDQFLIFNMSMTPLTAITSGQIYYIILPLLVGLVTYFSFKANAANMGQQSQMKSMTIVMMVLILVTSFSMSSAIILYWITNSGFTILQNLVVKKRS